MDDLLKQTAALYPKQLAEKRNHTTSRHRLTPFTRRQGTAIESAGEKKPAVKALLSQSLKPLSGRYKERKVWRERPTGIEKPATEETPADQEAVQLAALGRAVYERLLTTGEYLTGQHTYFNHSSGGFVVTHKGHYLSNIDAEMELARYHADAKGGWVQLLNERGGNTAKSDAHHGGPNGDGLDWEYKPLAAGGNPRTQLMNAVIKGRYPSGNILVRIIAPADVDAVNEGVFSGLTVDARNERARERQPVTRQIVVLWRTRGGYYEERLTFEEFYHEGLRFRGLQGEDRKGTGE